MTARKRMHRDRLRDLLIGRSLGKHRDSKRHCAAVGNGTPDGVCSCKIHLTVISTARLRRRASTWELAQ